MGFEKIIVFGATGNIGVYFVDYLKLHLDFNKYEIIAVGRKETKLFDEMNVKYINVDICNDDDFLKLPNSNVYAIVNLSGILPAYQKDNDYFKYLDINVKGSLRILEYAKKVGADRILYTQTWAEMAGYWGKKEVLSPKLERKLSYTGDHSFYSIAKSMVVETMKHFQEEFGIKSFVFRLPNIYLYNPTKKYYVNGKENYIGYRKMIDQAIKGEDIELWGDPKSYKDIVYVKDLCQMMYKALFADINGGLYCVGTGIKTTLEDQILGIIKVFSPKNTDLKIIYKPTKSLYINFIMDIENAREELGYNPKYKYIDMLFDYKKEMELKRFDSLWPER